MSTDSIARQQKGVPAGGQFATTAKGEADVALTGAAPLTPLGAGEEVTTASRAFRGAVTRVHAGCPQDAEWLSIQSIPVRPEALEPGYPWYSVSVHGSGSVCVPHYDVAPSVPAPTETERLTAEAQGAFAKLMVADPRAGHALWESMQSEVAGGSYPEMGVGQDDDGNAVFLDPDTGERTHLIVEDVAFRWNRTEELDANDKVTVVSYDGHGDYETLIYRSGATDAPVRLPDGWTEEGS